MNSVTLPSASVKDCLIHSGRHSTRGLMTQRQENQSVSQKETLVLRCGSFPKCPLSLRLRFGSGLDVVARPYNGSPKKAEARGSLL